MQYYTYSIFESGQAPQRQSGGSAIAEMRRKYIQFTRQSRVVLDASNKPTRTLLADESNSQTDSHHFQ